MSTKPTPDNKPATEKFPAKIYAETVLAVNFEDAKKYFLEALLEIHYSHTLMLTRQKIISRAEARTCFRALDGLDRTAIQSTVYDGNSEDLFFHIEEHLASASPGGEVGKMHTARSRNDIDITLYRMCFRRELLKLADAVLAVRSRLLELAAQNITTVMPAYTHTQPAQPTTLAHYLMAAIEFLGRDFQRIQSAFATVNRSPMGACAITTTGFPIDRHYTAELLGFEGLQVNSYGAIAAIDYLTESAAAVAVSMVNTGKLVQDLLLWCTKEYGFLRLSDAYVQISSIMPQKRNPASLEHTRILASKALAQAQAIFTAAHNTPFGDIVDSEDDLQPLAFSMFLDAERALKLLTGVVSSCEVQSERLRELANGGFLTVTELADTLVREEMISFRQAHHLVSATVKAVGESYDREQMIKELQRLAPELLGRELHTGTDKLRLALDPVHFVEIRAIEGGPAPSVIAAQIDETLAEIAQMSNWLHRKMDLLARYPRSISKAVQEILAN